MSSVDYCLNAVASVVQVGRRKAKFEGVTGTQMAVKDVTNSSFANLSIADGVALTDGVTVAQLNAASVGLSWKTTVRVCSTSSISVTVAPASIDGIAMVAGDRIALKAQSAAPDENGVWEYVAAAAPLIRPADWATGTDQEGSAFIINEGTCAEEMYVATANPCVVDTNDPLLVLIGTAAIGVSSLNDASVPGAGQESILATSGTGALTTNIFGANSQIAVNLAGVVLSFTIVALSIGAAQLTDQGVTAAKLAPGAGLITACFDIAFTAQGTLVTGPTILADSVVEYVTVNPSVAWDDTTTTLEVLVAGVSFMATDENDIALTGVQSCKGSLATTLAAVITANVAGGVGNTVGLLQVCVKYRVE